VAKNYSRSTNFCTVARGEHFVPDSIIDKSPEQTASTSNNGYTLEFQKCARESAATASNKNRAKHIRTRASARSPSLGPIPVKRENRGVILRKGRLSAAQSGRHSSDNVRQYACGVTSRHGVDVEHAICYAESCGRARAPRALFHKD